MSDERGTREAKHCELHGNQLTCAKCVEVASDPDHPMRRNDAQPRGDVSCRVVKLHRNHGEIIIGGARWPIAYPEEWEKAGDFVEHVRTLLAGRDRTRDAKAEDGACTWCGVPMREHPLASCIGEPDEPACDCGAGVAAALGEHRHRCARVAWQERRRSEAPACTPDPFSDWGCEARRKLGIARGALYAAREAIENQQAMPDQGPLDAIDKALVDTAQPQPCRDRSKAPASGMTNEDHAMRLAIRWGVGAARAHEVETLLDSVYRNAYEAGIDAAARICEERERDLAAHVGAPSEIMTDVACATEAHTLAATIRGRFGDGPRKTCASCQGTWTGNTVWCPHCRKEKKR